MNFDEYVDGVFDGIERVDKFAVNVFGCTGLIFFGTIGLVLLVFCFPFYLIGKTKRRK